MLAGNALAIGFIVDRATSVPWWGLAAVLVVLGAGWLKLRHPFLPGGAFKLDRETAAVLRTVVLGFLFFLECVAASLLILKS